ncbi:glycosyltransferase family 2 protein [Pedobacter psychroterrae]|uniref:Glycosyltransferase n=1 Tax=Pedobacter psychroterrae TaxID=2530453 RepID=A0A4R0NJU3_9SPHI|nr:glycosyltransferase family 2 protein [Pedobacter psychroterrae]TCD00806.1 glycosyltransferase [Pedobacter psychroterrae]
MKVSIVTVVFNCFRFIGPCIESVVSQDYLDIEYIMVDGGSVDGTISVIKKYMDNIDHFISDQDLGMYDALNKGIGMATGDLVGILNADDRLASVDVISSVVDCFRNMGCEAVYGNLKFIKRGKDCSITRNWKSKPYTPNDFLYGWMPPHPTLYIERSVLYTAGRYSLKFGTCADYDMILRLLYKNRVNAVFLDKLMVIMRKGGMSNGSVKKIVSAIINDYRVLVHNEIPNPLIALMLKKVRKLNQFFN